MAQTKIKFLVVGGGIGGVACAYALRRSGHDVHVLEEAKGLGQVRFSRQLVTDMKQQQVADSRLLRVSESSWDHTITSQSHQHLGQVGPRR